jgi:sulfite reductase (NADPH) flavoprotein alpha-component
MVGPGTGIAPFRAFLQEREATGATGPNWLFFGDQKSACDYLYREELLDMHERGVLTRIDTAFSRDQAAKLYVQDRMAENAAEIWNWLEDGACFYVCGDAKHMAKDVDTTLRRIIAEQGGRNEDQVESYMKRLSETHRYARDVY